MYSTNYMYKQYIVRLCTGPNYIELLKHKKYLSTTKLANQNKVTSQNTIPHVPYVTGICSFLLSRKLLSNIFCLSSSMKLGPGVSKTTQCKHFAVTVHVHQTFYPCNISIMNENSRIYQSSTMLLQMFIINY